MTWTATSYMVGTTSTGTTPAEGSPNTTPGGGDPIYLAPNRAGYSGVVGLLMTLDNGRTGTCSGTLVGNRSVVTAAHCVSQMDGVKWDRIVRTQVVFQDEASSDGDERFYDEWTGTPMPGVTAIDVSNYAVNPRYTGDVIDQNDIAVLTLAELAPAFAQRYGIYTEDLTGKRFNMAGYGLRSSVGATEGIDLPARSSDGFRRQGENVYDYAWGNGAFDGTFTDRDADGYTILGFAESEYSFVADFDSGSAAENSSCAFARREGGISAAIADSLGFCTRGVGPLEAMPSHGDSGGGGFIDGRLASVTSYGLAIANGTFAGGSANSGYGTLGGFVPIFIHADFIRNAIAAVPEPATWAQMLLGFGMIGVATRRRRRSVAFA
jgi:hypothetical protein